VASICCWSCCAEGSALVYIPNNAYIHPAHTDRAAPSPAISSHACCYTLHTLTCNKYTHGFHSSSPLQSSLMHARSHQKSTSFHVVVTATSVTSCMYSQITWRRPMLVVVSKARSSKSSYPPSHSPEK
jgi:hypothetical protein